MFSWASVSERYPERESPPVGVLAPYLSYTQHFLPVQSEPELPLQVGTWFYSLWGVGTAGLAPGLENAEIAAQAEVPAALVPPAAPPSCSGSPATPGRVGSAAFGFRGPVWRIGACRLLGRPSSGFG